MDAPTATPNTERRLALTPEGRWLAAVLACGPDAALSHRSAAALWELRAAGAARIDVTVPADRGVRSKARIHVHRARRSRTGGGAASVTIDGDDLCFGLTVTNISEPVAAHIHAGRRNQNGPIVVDLVPPDGGDPGSSSGCVTDDDAQAILRRPKRYYVNVHTGDFPGGAVRGQLFAKRR